MFSATDTIFGNIPSSLSIPTLTTGSVQPANSVGSASSVASTFIPAPTNLPAVIQYPNPVSPDANDTVIGVLFDQSLSWIYETNTTGAPAFIFVNFPITIANALQIDRASPITSFYFCKELTPFHFLASKIKTQNLTQFKPDDYVNPATDAAKLRTLYVAYIPTANVTRLSSYITTPGSMFYTASVGDSRLLAQRVDPSHPITDYVDPNSGNPAAVSSSGLSKKNQNIVIGVVTGLGGLALLIVGFLAYRAYKRRRDAKAALIAAGARPSDRSFDRLVFSKTVGILILTVFFFRDSQGSPRRRSFYFAEDSMAQAAPAEGSSPPGTEPGTSTRTRSPFSEPSATVRETSASGDTMSQIAPSGISSGFKSGIAPSSFSRFTEADSTRGMLGESGEH